MRTIEKLVKKAYEIGFEAEVISESEVKAWPKSKEQKQAFYKIIQEMKSEHPKFSAEITYDYSEMEVLSNEQRKQEIRKIGELVKQFGGFIEVDKGFQINCYMRSENQAEVIRKNKYKWYDLIFWLDHDMKRKSPVFINVKVLYSDGKALNLVERKRLFQRIEDISKSFNSELEIISRSELLIHASSVKRHEVLSNLMKKYKGLRIHTPDSMEQLSIQVGLAIT